MGLNRTYGFIGNDSQITVSCGYEGSFQALGFFSAAFHHCHQHHVSSSTVKIKIRRSKHQKIVSETSTNPALQTNFSFLNGLATKDP